MPEETSTPKEEVTPQKQRVLYKDVGYKTQQVGETWYPISTKWYKAWVAYTAYNKKDEDIDGGLDNLHLRDIPIPGPIDNSELADAEDPAQLKKGLEEHLTHEWVHSDQWKLLQSWYGGGPAFPRQICERGSSYAREKYINMYPKFLNFAVVNADGSYDISKPIVQSFSQQSTWQDVVALFEGTAEGEENSNPKVHLWFPFEHVKRIYPITTPRGVVVTLEDLKDEDPKRYVEIPDDQLGHGISDLEFPKDVVILVEKKREEKKAQEENPGSKANDSDEDNTTSQDNDKQNNNATTSNSNEEDEKFLWPLVKGPNKWKEFQPGDILDAQDDQRKWYEACIRFVGKEGTPNAGKLAVHFIGWADKWDEWVSIGNYERFALRHSNTKGKPHRPQKKQSYGMSYSSASSWSGYSNDDGKPEQKGVVGLRNLGNTCFMNSTIQCLAQSPYLTDYFLRGDFVHHINYNNPLGWKGKVAQAWAQLLKDMFSNQFRVVAPRDFKAAIGEVAPRFLGYSQQDSQELLSFLLDGLHEDLNQIQEKPGTNAVESNGRPDEVVAAEAWQTYLKRNVSIIVDLLQGQYKSRVECPDCDKVSITFDPYMFLSVPLPTERYKIMEFTWVSGDLGVLPTVYGIKMLKVADISMLKKSIAKQFNVPSDEVFVCDVWKSKIHRELKNRDMIAEINRRNDDIVVYHSRKPNEPVTKQDKTETEKTKSKDNENDSSKQKAKANGNKASEGEFDDEDTDYYSQAGRGGGSSNRETEQVPDFKVFSVSLQTRVEIRTTYQVREENELIGMPFYITFPMKRDVSHKEVRTRIFEMVKPYLKEKDKWNETSGSDSKPKDLPCSFYIMYGYNSVLQLEDNDKAFVPLNERGLRFVLHFPDRSEYNEEICIREKRARDESAPPPLTRDNYMEEEDRGSSKVELSACIDAFTEEEILDENDAWFCSKCSDFKCAKKKMDLWSSPDLLIIHLKRFSYTRQWRDRINTLVQFPLEGLDLSPWIVSEENKRDAVYDLYGISNHMGGMGGGHYTAYAKNLENEKWYELDDSRTTEITEPESMISSAAYVLYYKRRKPRGLKQRASRVVIPDVKTKTKGGTLQGTPEQQE